MRATLGGSSLFDRGVDLGVALGVLIALAGCNPAPGPGNDAAVDTGTPGNDAAADTGPVMITCPTGMVPNPSEQMGPCCYRVSQAAHLAMPELRLRYLHLTAPAGSALVTATVQNVLNGSLTNETFNWLMRGSGGTGDGPITITTGFGTRDATAGTYAFSTMAAYAPVMLNGTITGETVTTQPDPGVLVVPVFDAAGVVLQVQLSLHNVSVVTSTFSEQRSCIGALATHGAFTTAATLSGYLTVTDTRGSMINVDPIHAELCTLVASHNLTDPTSGPYCAQAQSTWTVMPDSRCPATGPCVHDTGSGSVCSHDGTGATPCNAWQLVSDFAAVGVEINP